MVAISNPRRANDIGPAEWWPLVATLRVGLASVLILALVIALLALSGLALPPHPTDALPEPGLTLMPPG